MSTQPRHLGIKEAIDIARDSHKKRVTMRDISTPDDDHCLCVEFRFNDRATYRGTKLVREHDFHVGQPGELFRLSYDRDMAGDRVM